MKRRRIRCRPRHLTANELNRIRLSAQKTEKAGRDSEIMESDVYEGPGAGRKIFRVLKSGLLDRYACRAAEPNTSARQAAMGEIE
jgi:hypothetical protein